MILWISAVLIHNDGYDQRCDRNIVYTRMSLKTGRRRGDGGEEEEYSGLPDGEEQCVRPWSCG